MNQPDLERKLDDEVQVVIFYLIFESIHIFFSFKELNFQILKNKKAYAELYAKLITADVERERNQVLLLESRRSEWKQMFLNHELEKFESVIFQIFQKFTSLRLLTSSFYFIESTLTN